MLVIFHTLLFSQITYHESTSSLFAVGFVTVVQLTLVIFSSFKSNYCCGCGPVSVQRLHEKILVAVSQLPGPPVAVEKSLALENVARLSIFGGKEGCLY